MRELNIDKTTSRTLTGRQHLSIYVGSQKQGTRRSGVQRHYLDSGRCYSAIEIYNSLDSVRVERLK